MNLGTLERIDNLRSVWPHEALDFTPWLAKEENLKLLGDTVGIDIVLEEQESSVGDFSVDLFAVEEGTGRKIIIENQLEDTNHDHLGKIITYASGKDAEVIIWIVKGARDEHKQAIEWLNQHTDERFAFFLIEIELWKIDDSKAAPKFNVVERPNDWAKAMKSKANMTETSSMKLNFWEEFNANASNHPAFLKIFKLRKPQAQHWYDLSIGSSAYIVNLTCNTQKNLITAGIYIHEDKSIFEKLKEKSEDIEKELGVDVEWRDAKKSSRIIVTTPLDLGDKDSWKKGFDWMYDMSLKLRNVVKKYDK